MGKVSTVLKCNYMCDLVQNLLQSNDPVVFKWSSHKLGVSPFSECYLIEYKDWSKAI